MFSLVRLLSGCFVLLCVLVDSNQQTQFVKYNRTPEMVQEIPTKGASAVKSFSIGDDVFLVFANTYGDKEGYRAKSVVYKMDNGRFVQNQTLSTHGAFGIEHFVIDKVHYMAIANLLFRRSFKTKSVIYKWSGGRFEEFQLISTNGGSGFKFFTIKGEHYLAVSEYSDGSAHSIDSSVYKWKRGRFVKYQNIPNGSTGCDSIEIEDETYLAYANLFYPQKTYFPVSLETKVYKWSGGNFVNSQTMQNQRASRPKLFSVRGHVFLALANCFPGYPGSKNHTTKSPIYKWDGAQFTLFQEISTLCVMDMCPFKVNGEMFLAVANYYGDSAGYSVRSVLYKWSGSQFTHYQEFQTFGGRGVEFIVDKGQSYLVFANSRKSNANFNVNSFVYKFV